jgi:hypothetical protein
MRTVTSTDGTAIAFGQWAPAAAGTQPAAATR